jgi:hypothetical protein
MSKTDEPASIHNCHIRASKQIETFNNPYLCREPSERKHKTLMRLYIQPFGIVEELDFSDATSELINCLPYKSTHKSKVIVQLAVVVKRRHCLGSGGINWSCQY